MPAIHNIHVIQKSCNKRLYALRGEIGTKIHALRLSRRMTLRKLSLASGLSVPLLDLLECGRGEVNLYHIIALARAFKVPESCFISGPDSPQEGRVQDAPIQL